MSEPNTPENKDGITRRRFIVGTSAALVAGGVVGGVIGSSAFKGAEAPPAPAPSPAPAPVPSVPLSFMDPGGPEALKKLVSTVPASKAYLVHDSMKCAGCLSCMAACSAAHDKKASLSTSRIQITQNALNAFPFDLDQYICRQCTSPQCVQSCPTGACCIDTANGNVRVIDESKCIGCQTCLKSCPQIPHRTVWNAETNKSSKCDLCANAPYLGAAGGPQGTQACVSVCPMGALSVVNQLPAEGYEQNLRGKKVAAIKPLFTPQKVRAFKNPDDDWMLA